MRAMKSRLAGVAFGAIGWIAAVACGSSDKNGTTIGELDGGNGAGGSGAVTGAGGAGTGTGATAGTGTAGTGTGGTGTTSGNGGTSSGAGGTSGAVAECKGFPVQAASGDASTCGGISLEAERVDVDMYIMMDRSVSMVELVGTTGKSRWELVRDAVEKFVMDPGAANIGVGIQFFGASGSKDDTIDCDPSRYATPAVPIGLASQNGAAIVAAVDATLPGGITPTLPALQGAIQYGEQWASTHAGRATVVVLVTDGYPTQCQDPVSISEIADAAKAGAQNIPPVRTYVVGLAAGFNLDSIARAGGTANAFNLDEGDVTTSFVSTLQNITNDKLSCEYQLPEPTDPSQPLDVNKVQVVYTPAVGDPEEVPKANGAADCANSKEGGWYYDTPTNPTKILVCPCTCSRFAAGKVDIKLGCAPRPISIG